MDLETQLENPLCREQTQEKDRQGKKDREIIHIKIITHKNITKTIFPSTFIVLEFFFFKKPSVCLSGLWLLVHNTQ